MAIISNNCERAHRLTYCGAGRVNVAVGWRARLEVDVVSYLFLNVQRIHFIVAAGHHADLQQDQKIHSKTRHKTSSR
jgi:hypothetical protein